MKLAPALLALLLALPAQAQETGLSPAQLGDIFCIASLAGDMAPVMGLLADDFTAEIDKAQAASDAWAKANPGEKPPLGDGLPWREYPDYADGCTVGPVTVDGAEASVAIDYSFSEAPEADYRNALRLEQVEIDLVPRWRIVNVDFSSADAGSMRQWLSEASTFP